MRGPLGSLPTREDLPKAVEVRKIKADPKEEEASRVEYFKEDKVFADIGPKNETKLKEIFAGLHPASQEEDFDRNKVFLDIGEHVPVEMTKFIPKLSKENPKDYIKRVCTLEENIVILKYELIESADNIVGPAKLIFDNQYLHIEVVISKDENIKPIAKVTRKDVVAKIEIPNDLEAAA
jgi:hypothetical protein